MDGHLKWASTIPVCTVAVFTLALGVVQQPLTKAQTLYYNRASFLSDSRVTNTTGIDFDTLPVGTDLKDQSLFGVKFEAPGSSPLSVIAAATGVRHPMSASSGLNVLSPGGSNPNLENDDLSLVFDTPVSAVGLDVVFDVPDGASYVGVRFLDAAGNQIAQNGSIPAPNGSPGFQFVGLVADTPLIKKVVFDEFDPTAPDDNVAYDSVTFQPGACTPAPPGLVSWYPLDGSAVDITGGNQPSSVSGLTFVAGKVNQGVSLGTGGFIEIPHLEASADQRFTWEAWARPDGPDTANDQFGSLVIAKGTVSGTFAYSLNWRSSDQRFLFICGNINASVTASAHSYPPGQFYHVAGTYDGTAFRLYVNGELEGTLAQVTTIQYNTSIPWTIGSAASLFGYSRRWNGVIDEVSIYDRPLSQTEIAAIYAAGSLGKCHEIPTISAGFIYWSTVAGTNPSEIRRARLDGSQIEALTLHPASSRFGAIAFDLANGYLYSGDGSTLFRSNLDGTGRTNLITNTRVADIELDLAHGKIYWSDFSGIRRANLDGTGNTSLISGVGSCEGFAVDAVGGKLYCAFEEAGVIKSANLDGTGLANVATLGSTSNPFEVEFDGNLNRFFWNEYDSGIPSHQRIGWLNSDGSGGIQTVLSSPQNGLNTPLFFDSADGKVYFAWGSSPPAILRCNLDGSGLETVLIDTAAAGINYFEVIHADLPPIPPDLPDLAVNALTIPASVAAGDPLQLTLTITNQGSATATAPWTNSVYLASDPAGAGGQQIGTFAVTGNLEAGSSTTLTPTFNIPLNSPGPNYIVVKIDTASQVSEITKANNTFVSQQPVVVLVPDLIVTDIQAPSSALTDSAFEVQWTISNIGPAPTRAQWVDRIYLSRDEVVGDDIFVGQFPYTAGLGSGETATRVQAVSIPRAGITDGNYRIVVVTDAGNSVNEGASENNNALVDDVPIVVKLTPLPDLVVQSIAIPATAFSDQTITVHWTVRNQGSGSTDASAWYDRVFLSTDQIPDGSDGWQVNVQNASYLAPGEAYTASVNVKVPLTAFGTYYIIVAADVGGNVREENEQNNFTPKSIEIQLTPPPDLQVTSVEAPANSFSAQTIPVSWTVANLGAGAVPPEHPSWNDTVLLAPGPTLGPGAFSLYTQRHTGALGTEENYSVNNANVKLPPNISGDFYLFVQTDSGNEVFEYGLDNNNTTRAAGPIHVTLTPPPDLVVGWVKAPNDWTAGQPLSVSWKVLNQGAGDTVASLWYDSLWVSTHSTFDGSATRIGDFYHAGILEPEASYTNTVSYTPPICNSANYYFFVVADSYHHVSEFDPDFDAEANNTTGTTSATVVSAPTVPDLVLISVLNPGSANAGQAVHFTWTVKNAGVAGTPTGSWVDRVYLSTSAAQNSAAALLGTFQHNGALAAGAEYTQEQDATIPANLSGVYYVFVQCDADNAVIECTGEGNNTGQSASPLNVTPIPPAVLPDFEVMSISPPTVAQSGQPISISYVVANSGPGDSPTATWQDSVYLSKDPNLSGDDVFLGSVTQTGAIARTKSYDGTALLQLPFRLSGDYYVLVCADASQTISETSDQNNCLSSSTTIHIDQAPLADLRVTSVTAPSAGLAGQDITVAWTVTNSGDNTTETSTWTDYVYLSRDQILDPTDPQLGYVVHSGVLPFGQSYTQSSSLTLPRGLSGSYYAFVVADRGDRVFELNENNNNGYAPAPIQVELPAPADLVVESITVPPSGSPGQPGSISWVVRNQGPNVAAGTWQDSVYLSSDPVWDINDALVGKVQRSGPMASGASYTASINAPLPGVAPGQYYVLVRADILNNVRETDESNNLAVSSGQVTVDVTELQLGVPFSAQLTQGAEQYYKVSVPSDQVMSVTLDGSDANGFNELFTRFGEPPNRGEYDFLYSNPFEPDQQITVPQTQAGFYYQLARGEYVPNPPTPYVIKADVVPFSITSVTPTRIGDNGQVTITIRGALFRDGATVQLVNGPTVLPASKVTILDSATAKARFYLTDAIHGLYDVVLTNPLGDIATAEKSLTIETALPLAVSTGMMGNQTPRAGRSTTFTCAARNTANVDAPYILVQINVDGATAWTLRRPATTFPRACPECPASALASVTDNLSDPSQGFVARDVEPGEELTFQINIGNVSSRTVISFGAAAKSPDDFIAQLGAFAEALRQAVLENPGIPVAGPFLEALGDPGGWRTIFTDELRRAGWLDAPTAALLDERHQARSSSLKVSSPSDTCAECARIKQLCLVFTTAEAVLCFAECYPAWAFSPAAYITCVVICEATTIFLKHKLCDVQYDRCVLDCRRLDCLNAIADGNVSGAAVCPQYASDPNEIRGPAGYGANAYVSGESALPFTVYFENVTDATAVARQLRIISQLDLHMDSRTARIQEIGFGGYQIRVPENRSYYQARVTLGPDFNDLLADISAGIDIQKGQLVWTITAIDSATGEPPENPNIGLLPPNNANHVGEGYVVYTVRPKAGTSTGTVISNKATIVFDNNEPIDTNPWQNTIDGAAPASAVISLPAHVLTESFQVAWSGVDDDGGSGLQAFDIYASDNGGPYELWLANTLDTSSVYAGVTGHIYSFYSVAHDNAGNVEAAPETPDAQTIVMAPPPAGVVIGRHLFYNGSAWDGGDAGPNASDDDAIAPDKVALQHGGIGNFANLTSYTKGINGIMVDLVLNGVPTVADFSFKVGNDNAPGSWLTGPTPLSITVRLGAGNLGSDRVTLIWTDGAIKKQWLEVTVLPTAVTGLSSPDIFYFGNAIGETGDSTTDALVNGTDESATRANSRGFGNPAPIDFRYDFNRDKLVNGTDVSALRANATGFGNALRLIDLRSLSVNGLVSPLSIPKITGAVTERSGQSPATSPWTNGSGDPALKDLIHFGSILRVSERDIRIQFSAPSGAQFRLQWSSELGAEWQDLSPQPDIRRIGELFETSIQIGEKPQQYYRMVGTQN